MGRFAFTLVAGVLFCGAAQASSILTLGAMDESIGPSTILIGAPAEPAMAKEETATGTQLAYPFPGGVPAPVVSVDAGTAAGDSVARSPSIVSLVSPDNTVNDEKEDTRGAVHFTPMVIRGGIVGDAFARTVAPQPVNKTASAGAPSPAWQPQSEPAATLPPPANMPELPAPR